MPNVAAPQTVAPTKPPTFFQKYKTVIGMGTGAILLGLAGSTVGIVIGAIGAIMGMRIGHQATNVLSVSDGIIEGTKSTAAMAFTITAISLLAHCEQKSPALQATLPEVPIATPVLAGLADFARIPHAIATKFRHEAGSLAGRKEVAASAPQAASAASTAASQPVRVKRARAAASAPAA